MTIKLKDIRYKHQKRAIEIRNLPEAGREPAFIEFAFSLIESWDYRGEDGQILPIGGIEVFDELRIEDIEEMSEAINAALFPEKVKKTSGSPLPSGSTPSKAERNSSRKSPSGLTTS